MLAQPIIDHQKKNKKTPHQTLRRNVLRHYEEVGNSVCQQRNAKGKIIKKDRGVMVDVSGLQYFANG